MAELTSTRNSYVASRSPGTRTSKSAAYRWLSWTIPAIVVLLWEAAARFGLIAPQVLPAPSRVFETAVTLARNGDLFVHLGVSLLRAAAGFAIGATVGLALGIAVGFSPLTQALLDRPIQMVRAIPFL